MRLKEKMNRVLITFLIGAITFAISTAWADDQFHKIMVNGQVGYILSEKIAPEQMGWTDGMVDLTKINGYWTPSFAEVLKADGETRKFIHSSTHNAEAAYPSPSPHSEKFKRNAENEIKLVWKNLDKYTVQFVGIIRGKKKSIYCNYFDLGNQPLFDLDPSKRLISVNDGGFYFWQVEYDLESQSCSSLQINGPWALDSFSPKSP